ncbi:uroporphyrinogen-III C-methyltransferase [Lewinella sp. LCG006]|uniref:uroporphyrinogen-III C-methyltransferase n=1 Tax=Lewinella sp. LCG006 TaxID=3231911 RepID=UPI00346176B6
MKSFNQKAKITLVGAGPGDPELLTLKGLRAIKTADVILYDSLANPELLDHNPYAHKVFVGKRKGYQRFSQDQINSLLVDFAKFPYHIVRLKGGDPMVFGRAMEEIETARAHNIPVEVIPGISSYAGAAAYQQLPITERGVSRSFWVVTGTDRDGQLSKDLALAAQSSATVIVLMGMSKLDEIVQLFSQHKPLDYPVSIVQNATRPDVRSLSGQLDNIVALNTIAQLASPGILIFGAAARHLDTIAPHLATLKTKEQ